MIRAIVAIYAFGLLAFPVWELMAPEDYRATLAEDFGQAATAELSQLQMAAVIHWLKNAYLAFAFLLLARYVGNPIKPGDVTRAGWLLTAFPLVLLVYQVLSQLALSTDPENLDLNLSIRSSMLLYVILGLVLVGIAQTITRKNEEGAEP